MKILLLIPAFNEEESLPLIIPTLKEKYSQFDFIILNDGSKDRTLEVARNLEANVLDLCINQGLGAALQPGFKYGLENDYDYFVQFDSDGQHLPEYIQLLIDKAQEGNDIVIGSRFLDGTGTYNQTILRGFGGKWLSTLIRFTTGKKITDPTSGMRVYNKKIARKLMMLDNMPLESDFLVMAHKSGYKISEVQVTMQERVAGETYFSPLKAVKFMFVQTISIIISVFRKDLKERK
ncbi:MAG: glycosyltransferase family 2 protein [Culicoidibacterales bacterium]